MLNFLFPWEDWDDDEEPLKLKKIPYYLILLLLTAGASLILGLLSFSGMFALWPILSIACVAFVLSVAYEGEIYLQNIKGSLNKLFKPNYLKRHHAGEYLRSHFPETHSEACPQFFRDYEAQLHLLHAFEHKRLDRESRARKRQLEKTLGDMEKWFTKLFFSKERIATSFEEKELRTFLNEKLILFVSSLKLPNEEYTDCFVYCIASKSLYQFDDYGNHTQENNDDAFMQNLDAIAYQAQVFDWLTGCDLHTTNSLSVDKTYTCGYVFIESEKKLVYFNAEGEAEVIAVSDIDLFKQKLSQIMDDKHYKHLTHEQIKSLDVSGLINSQTRYQQQLDAHTFSFRCAQVVSWLAVLFMSFGTSFLLIEAFSVIPFLSTLSIALWPVFIVPMALVAGMAYGLLTYNAITDMITNDTLRSWYKKIQNDLSQGITVRNVFLATTAVVLFTLTLALTICTAGTWWTVVKNSPPLFAWMKKIPAVIVQIFTPVVIGLTTLVFNLENTFETLGLIFDLTKNSTVNFFTSLYESIKKAINHILATENIGQILNPFRIILKLTVTPLRILLFLGHLISIGVTADRFPGIPEIVSALLGIISEGFEDAHYFFNEAKHDHECKNRQDLLNARFDSEHGHSHEADIPTRVLQGLFYPVYLLAALWDFVASQWNTDKKKVHQTFKVALEKQKGLPPKENIVLPNSYELLNLHLDKEQIEFADIQHLINQSSVILFKNELYYADKNNNLLQKIILEDNFNQTILFKLIELREILSKQPADEIHYSTKKTEQIIATLLEHPSVMESASIGWQKQHIIHLIEEQQEKLNQAQLGKSIATEKIKSFEQLKEDVYTLDLKQPKALRARVTTEIQKDIYQAQRLPTLFSANTQSSDELEDLVERTELQTRPQSPTSIADLLDTELCPEGCKVDHKANIRYVEQMQYCVPKL